MKFEDALSAIKKISKENPISIDRINDIIERCELLEITDSDSFSGSDETRFVGSNGLTLEYSFSVGSTNYKIWKRSRS